MSVSESSSGDNSWVLLSVLAILSFVGFGVGTTCSRFRVEGFTLYKEFDFVILLPVSRFWLLELQNVLVLWILEYVPEGFEGGRIELTLAAVVILFSTDGAGLLKATLVAANIRTRNCQEFSKKLLIDAKSR